MPHESEWPQLRLGNIASVKARIGWKGLQADEYLEKGYVFLATPNIKGHRIDFRNVNYISERRYIESPELMLEPDDVLLVKDGSTLGISNIVRELPSPATINGSMALLRCSDRLSPAFLHQLTKAHLFQKLVQDKKSGLGVPHLFQADLREFEILLPPLPEQRRIAEILDTLDEAIRKTEQVIAKLQQMKQGLLHDLLTRGIDENGELRDPEWHPEQFKDSPLGRLPREWEICQLGNLAFLQNGYSFKEHELVDMGMRIVRISNLKKPDFPYWHFGGEPPAKLIIRRGDLLFTWAGVAVSIDVFLYDGPDALLNQHIYNLRVPTEEMRIWVFHCVKVQLPLIRRSIEGGAGQLHLTREQVAGIQLPIPPDVELRALLSMIESHRTRVSKEEVERDKLLTLKNGLMDDLLTGRVRVTVSKGTAA